MTLSPDQLLLERIHQIEEEHKTRIDNVINPLEARLKIMLAIIKLAATSPHRQDLRLGSNGCKDDCPSCIAYRFLTGKLSQSDHNILGL